MQQAQSLTGPTLARTTTSPAELKLFAPLIEGELYGPLFLFKDISALNPGMFISVLLLVVRAGTDGTAANNVHSRAQTRPSQLQAVKYTFAGMCVGR
jgi:hypothetical protein